VFVNKNITCCQIPATYFFIETCPFHVATDFKKLAINQNDNSQKAIKKVAGPSFCLANTFKIPFKCLQLILIVIEAEMNLVPSAENSV
jgi:hypothetical protein